MQCNAVQCSVLQLRTVQYRALESYVCSPSLDLIVGCHIGPPAHMCSILYTLVHCDALVHCTTLHCTAVFLLCTLNHCIALHPCALQCNAVHSILPRSIRSRNACSIKGGTRREGAAGINRASYHWQVRTLGQLHLDICTLISLGIRPVQLWASLEFSRFLGLLYTFPFLQESNTEKSHHSSGNIGFINPSFCRN